MKPVIIHGSVYYGSHNGEDYLIQDEQAPLFFRYWTEANNEPCAVVSKVLSNTELWGTDLQALPGFREAVTTKLKQALELGMKPVLESTLKLSQVNES